MSTDSHVRPIKLKDLPALKTVIDANQLFSSDMLYEMISDYFKNKNSRGL